MKYIHLIPDINNLEKTMKFADKYHAVFEYNDFFLPQVFTNQAEVQRRIQIYKALDRDRSNDTLHGAFLDITIHSQDEAIRKVSEERVRQSLSIAETLGIRGVVFHANLIPGYYADAYLEGWLNASTEFWKRMLLEFPSLEIYIENMFEARVNELKRLVEAMRGETRFGICLDYAHTMVFGKDGKDWVKKLAPYIRHCHVNDNDLQGDLHWAVGKGRIDWKDFSDRMRKNQVDTSVLIEVKDLDEWEEAFLFMKKMKVYPYCEKEKEDARCRKDG